MFKLIFPFLFSLFSFFLFLKFLNKRGLFQTIYHLAPKKHQQKKDIPSFGGLLFPLLLFFFSFLFLTISNVIFWCCCCFFAFALLGFYDDFLSKKRGSNKGLSARQKSFFQLLLAVFFVLTFHFYILPLSWIMNLFFIFLFVAVSNASNLTDGLDGLLGSTALITLAAFTFLFFLKGDGPFFYFVFFMMSIVAAFLLFNCHPAKIFMGDSGSLSLGAFFVCLSCYLNDPFLLLGLCSLFLIETLSVMIQVFTFKRFKKRIFLMTPLHHHFELLNFSEGQIVRSFFFVHLFFTILYFTSRYML